MYFGLRFTVDDSKTAPKVSFHKVVVTHPFRNGAGLGVRIESSWEQNGYSASNIFLGWHFDENEEILEGDYHFGAYDTDGILMVEKILNITL